MGLVVGVDIFSGGAGLRFNDGSQPAGYRDAGRLFFLAVDPGHSLEGAYVVGHQGSAGQHNSNFHFSGVGAGFLFSNPAFSLALRDETGRPGPGRVVANFGFERSADRSSSGDGNVFFAGQGDGRIKSIGPDNFYGVAGPICLAIAADHGYYVFARPAAV